VNFFNNLENRILWISDGVIKFWEVRVTIRG